MDNLSVDELKNILSYTNIYDKINIRLISNIFSKIISKGIVIRYLILTTYKIGFTDGYCTNCTNQIIDLDKSIKKVNRISEYLSQI